MDSESWDWPTGDRRHVRYNQTYHRDGLGRLETVATPHKEELWGCGHVVVSFISARNNVLNAMNPPYGYVYHFDGNDAALRQCNGSYVASDGYSVWINIG